MPGIVERPLLRALILAGLLTGCAEPEALRRPPGGPGMAIPAGGDLPLPALAEPTGGPRIALPESRGAGPTALSPAGLSAGALTPTSAPRSGPGAMP